MTQIHFTTPPSQEHDYKVGDRVEVYCDHEEKEERVRGWLDGVVVQADIKMIAIQFQIKVYLTDGWMVPDHVLWCLRDSHSIRFAKSARRKKQLQK
ncbi:MAG: hypothetical protein MUO64_21750 [Anaerolineales bacterium]|nr:hypothetical protein [Anaerolineales bacterium]